MPVMAGFVVCAGRSFDVAGVSGVVFGLDESLFRPAEAGVAAQLVFGGVLCLISAAAAAFCWLVPVPGPRF